MPRRCFAVLFPSLSLLIALACPGAGPEAAFAQTRSDTGRHQAAPPAPEKKPETQPEKADAGGRAASEAWTFGFSAGLQGAGRAFSVETVEGIAVPWEGGGGSGFNASRFHGTFNQNLSLGLQAGRGLGTHLGARATVGYSRMDLGAEALAGQSGMAVLMDRVDVYTLGLGLTARLVKSPSHPYLAGEAVLTSLDAGLLDALDQTNLAWRLGLGYRRVLDENFAGRLEARLARGGFSLGDYAPRSLLPDTPEVTVDGADHLTFFEIILTIELH